MIGPPHDAPMYWIWLTKTVSVVYRFLCQRWTLSMAGAAGVWAFFGTMLMHSTVRQKRFDGYPVIWSLACRLSEWHWATNIKIIKSPKVRLQINTFVSSKIVTWAWTCHWTEDKNRLDPNMPKQQSGSRTSHWHAFTKSQNPNKPNESTQGRTEDWPSKSVQDRIW